MKTPQTLFLLLAPVLLAVQISLSEPHSAVAELSYPIVNVHESVESVAEIIKLQKVMGVLGMTNVILQGIPEDLIDFGSEEADLSAVEENNAELKQVFEAYPEQFSYFCSIDPNDADRLNVLEECLNNGAIGVKLYNGYTYAHELSIDDAKLSDFYSTLADRQALLMLPVNTSYYELELRNMLTLNPNLTVICPHFCLSSKDLTRLGALLSDFPNLYVDTSFGSLDFVKEGFETISENRENYKTFFNTYQDRILFGTDTVLTSYENKSMDWLTELYGDYLALFSEAEFDSELLQASYTGLELPQSILRKVFYKNWYSAQPNL